MKPTIERLKDVIAETLGNAPASITEASHLVEDLGADSLDQVELVMAIEEEVNVEIPDEDAEKLETVGQWVAFLDELSEPPAH